MDNNEPDFDILDQVGDWLQLRMNHEQQRRDIRRRERAVREHFNNYHQLHQAADGAAAAAVCLRPSTPCVSRTEYDSESVPVNPAFGV